MELIAYDNEGKIYFTLGDKTEAITLNTIVAEVPEDKILVSIDPTTKEPIFEDRPLSVEERLAQLEASQSDQDDAIFELSNSVGE